MLYMLITLDERLELGYSAFSGEETFEIFITEYDEVKFLLRRIYFGLSESEAWVNLQEKLEAGRITMRMLYQAVQTCVFDSDGLWDKIYTYYCCQILKQPFLIWNIFFYNIKYQFVRHIVMSDILIKLLYIRRSDAKYKVYLHQDVLIVNPNIILDLLDIFKESSVGMVGVTRSDWEIS